MTSRRPLLLRFRRPVTTIAARLGYCLTCVLLLAGTVHALDPNNRVTQYLHKSWRMDDGSAPAAIFAIAQTSDGFLWFSAQGQGLYRFDGVQFLPRAKLTLWSEVSTGTELELRIPAGIALCGGSETLVVVAKVCCECMI